MANSRRNRSRGVATDGATGDRIQAAALHLFAARGFGAVGIRQIAEEAGISVASLYHYMGTKEDLLERMMRQSMQDLIDPSTALLKSTNDPVERLKGLVDIHVRKHARDNLLSMVGDTELRSLSPAARKKIITLRDRYEKMWSDVIASGTAAGHFTVVDVKLATLGLLAMCTGVVRWYSPTGRLSLDAICAGFEDMALRAVGFDARGAERRSARPGQGRQPRRVGARVPQREAAR